MYNKSQDGFSYVEVIIAIVILMVGILALLSAITASVVQASGQQRQLAAKQIATTTLESIMSVKETGPNRLGWPAVGNVGSNLDASGVPQGIFVNGVQPVRAGAGADRVVGTADDNLEEISDVGRQIIITDICDPDRPSPNCPTPGTAGVRMRSVQVTIFYNVGSIRRQETLATVLTDYSTN